MNGNGKRTVVAVYASLILATFPVVLGAQPVGVEFDPDPHGLQFEPVPGVPPLLGSWVPAAPYTYIERMEVRDAVPGDTQAIVITRQGERLLAESFVFKDGIVSFSITGIPEPGSMSVFQGKIDGDGNAIQGNLQLSGSGELVPLIFHRQANPDSDPNPPAGAPGGSYSESCSSFSWNTATQTLTALCTSDDQAADRRSTLAYAFACAPGSTVGNNDGTLTCDKPCPPGVCCGIENCTSCPDQICTACDRGFWLSESGCAKCSAANCTFCPDDRCSQCDSGYWLDGGSCSACSLPFCAVCPNDKCTECVAGKFLSESEGKCKDDFRVMN